MGLHAASLSLVSCAGPEAELELRTGERLRQDTQNLLGTYLLKRVIFNLCGCPLNFSSRLFQGTLLSLGLRPAGASDLWP